MKIKTMTNILITVIVLLACTSAEAGHHRHSRSGPSDPSISSEAYAEEEHYNAVRYPYGRSKKGAYGERQSVMTEDEARTSLKEYFENNVTINNIRERKFYFEAEIRDSRGNLIDRVIIDRRTGRIRSIY